MCRQTVILLLKSPLYFLFLALIAACLFSIDLQSIMFPLVPKVNVFTFSGVWSKTVHVLMGLLPFFFLIKNLKVVTVAGSKQELCKLERPSDCGRAGEMVTTFSLLLSSGFLH